jgi:hypothetical protein
VAPHPLFNRELNVCFLILTRDHSSVDFSYGFSETEFIGAHKTMSTFSIEFQGSSDPRAMKTDGSSF